MKNKKMDRRRFLIHSLQGAAGAGVLAGCDKRAVIGTDVRPPSTPVGLSQKLSLQASQLYSVDLSWTPHDGTDITGAKTETAITYNVYRKTDLQAAFGTVPIATQLPTSSFSDTSTDVQDAFARLKTNPDIVFEYKISAIDATRANESPATGTCAVPIQPFIDIFFVTKPEVATGTLLTQPKIQPDIVKTMLHAAVMKLTNKTSIAAAWESLFPSLSASTLIGIKINTLGMGNVSTKPPVVDAIVDGLTQMLGGTFPAYNIIVFDDRGKDSHMKPAGYIVRNTPGMYRITSTHYITTLDSQLPLADQQLDANLWGTPFPVATANQRLSKLVEALDYIINVPVLKDHIQAGITFSMKNLYGIVDNPAQLHDNMCNPFIPSLYNTETNGVKLRDKIRLIVGDAIVGCWSGGPAGGPNVKPCTIVVGTDPVAMDKWALDKINSYRSAKARIPLTFEKDASQDARHIFYASQPPYSLGSTNYAAREVVV